MRRGRRHRPRARRRSLRRRSVRRSRRLRLPADLPAGSIVLRACHLRYESLALDVSPVQRSSFCVVASRAQARAPNRRRSSSRPKSNSSSKGTGRLIRGGDRSRKLAGVEFVENTCDSGARPVHRRCCRAGWRSPERIGTTWRKNAPPVRAEIRWRAGMRSRIRGWPGRLDRPVRHRPIAVRRWDGGKSVKHPVGQRSYTRRATASRQARRDPTRPCRTSWSITCATTSARPAKCRYNVAVPDSKRCANVRIDSASAPCSSTI